MNCRWNRSSGSVAVLRPGLFIVYGQMLVDAAGVVHEGGRPLDRIHAVANAPMFSDQDFFRPRDRRRPDDATYPTSAGRPPLLPCAFSAESRRAASRRLRSGGSPRYDWRELKRWNISESQLPPGSEVLFRVPSVWEEYRPQLTAVMAAILLQAGIISLLLVERRRRLVAQAEADQSPPGGRSSEPGHDRKRSVVIDRA